MRSQQCRSTGMARWAMRPSQQQVDVVDRLYMQKENALDVTLVGKPAALPESKVGVSCANIDAQGGIGAMDEIRPFDLKQSKSPVEPLNIASQTFSPEGQATLFTTVKGDPTVNKTWFLSAFSVYQRRRINECSLLQHSDNWKALHEEIAMKPCRNRRPIWLSPESWLNPRQHLCNRRLVQGPPEISCIH
ncbi:hypothetical protein K504DRAFT_507630 [Pleomassaria siparia CBS 279.74]|uniref:Uncharacterized protein n=1 Tax=Pleomassaria siparia CBS 279.74 TaxID=1314801 RepID=A0A6G1JSX7_9PLEO|nr:hypothetical protein K504DRAFT_507630 [Pleomassaria siparia CBS 279.74]